ncbi:LuxR C-terminal-related transcriptional regulator [Streptomyces sp. NPDC019539]|uniref:LuxR C-terminal-related transcriptional regulator n=1 Tax=Streptomyces sp. NPDC019539 TaxID=3365063 RepID=UPI0037891E66
MTGDRKRYVLTVDGLEILDNSSANLIAQLIESGDVFLLATIRPGVRVSEAAFSIQCEDSTLHIELDDFTPSETNTALHSVLSGHIEPRTTALLYERTRGNPLYLRETVIAALASETMVNDHGVWQMVGDISTTGRLRDLVGRRLDEVGASARKVLEMLAVSPILGTHHFRSEISELEEKCLIQVNMDERREHISLSHPLYGDLILQRMTSSRRRELLREQISRLESTGARRREDCFLLSSWYLEVSGTADPELLLHGALLARNWQDFHMVQKLAAALCRVHDECLPKILLGEALFEIGQFAEAWNVLKGATACTANDREIVLAAVSQSRMLAWGVVDYSEALRVNDEALNRTDSRQAYIELEATRGSLLVSFGMHKSALDILTQLNLDSYERAQLLGKSTEAIALIATGRTKDGLSLGRETYALRLHSPDSVGLPHPAQYLVSVIFGLTESGQLQEAYDVAMQGWEDATADNAPGPQAWLAIALARCALLQGKPATCRKWAEQGAVLARRYSLPGTLRIALSWQAEGAANQGDIRACKAALSEAVPLPPWGIFKPELVLGEAWLAVASGDLREARKMLREAVIQAREEGNFASEARILLECVRLGIQEEDEASRLMEIATMSDSVISSTYANYAAAKSLGDPQKILAVSIECENVGAFLLASEAAASAATEWRRQGSRRPATAAEIRMSNIVVKCEGARTPGLIDTSQAASLTKRETEIAMLAAKGLTSTEIAEQVFITRKTVENHLQNIYVKLGVSNRKSLRSIFE